MINVSPLAGKPAPASMLINIPRLVTAYYAEHPDPSVSAERVMFGTSGHRGSAFGRSFNEAHILAITQAICSYRKLYAESFRDRPHLERIQAEAQALVTRLFAQASV
jgi:phosphoglucomutase